MVTGPNLPKGSGPMESFRIFSVAFSGHCFQRKSQEHSVRFVGDTKTVGLGSAHLESQGTQHHLSANGEGINETGTSSYCSSCLHARNYFCFPKITAKPWRSCTVCLVVSTVGGAANLVLSYFSVQGMNKGPSGTPISHQRSGKCSTTL